MDGRRPGPGESYGGTRRVGGGELTDDVEGHAFVRGPQPDGQAARENAPQATGPEGIGSVRGPDHPVSDDDDVEGHAFVRGPEPEGHSTAR